jgi:hypothetical protein
LVCNSKKRKQKANAGTARFLDIEVAKVFYLKHGKIYIFLKDKNSKNVFIFSEEEDQAIIPRVVFLVYYYVGLARMIGNWQQ